MRVEMSGALITNDVLRTLRKLQKDTVMTEEYYITIDEVTRKLLLRLYDNDGDNLAMLSRLSLLQQLRNDILSLAEPLDEPEDTTPAPQY